MTSLCIKQGSEASVKKPKIWLYGLIFSFISLLSAMAIDAWAEPVSFNVSGVEGETAAKLVQIFVLMSVLSLAPSLAVMVTSFTRIIVVLSFMRHAMGLQQSPPNMVVTSLALFLTFFIMTPVFEKMYDEGLSPWFEKKIDEQEAWKRTTEPLKLFMLHQTRKKDLQLFADVAKTDTAADEAEKLPLYVVVPSFMISELRRAFEIGFMLFIPFLIIDMVVASVLMSMGMMMLPPVMISMPFKVIFFVLIDGWRLVAGSLIQSFNTV